MFIEIWTHERVILTYWKVQIVRKRKLDKMTISNFEWLSGNIVQRDMSLVWWAGSTYALVDHVQIFQYSLSSSNIEQ